MRDATNVLEVRNNIAENITAIYGDGSLIMPQRGDPDYDKNFKKANK